MFCCDLKLRDWVVYSVKAFGQTISPVVCTPLGVSSGDGEKMARPLGMPHRSGGMPRVAEVCLHSEGKGNDFIRLKS